MTILQQLREAGLQVRRGAGDQLYLRGAKGHPLAELARSSRPQLLEELSAEAQAAGELYRCPRGHFDYRPLGNGLRRCYRCGRVYRDRQDLPPTGMQQPRQRVYTSCSRLRDLEGHERLVGDRPCCHRHFRLADPEGRCPVSQEVLH